MKPIRRFSLTAAALATVMACPSLAHAGDIVASLSSDSAAQRGNQDVFVKLTLTNTGARPAKLLKWFVPGEAEAGPVFQIQRDGREIPFEGPEPKRAAPRASDYLTLNPGQSLTRRIELSSSYNLAITGNYSIQYDVESLNLHSNGAASTAPGTAAMAADIAPQQVQAIASNAVNLSISGRPMSWAEQLGEHTPLQAASLNASQVGSVQAANCTNTRAAQIEAAYQSARGYANDAVNYLNAGKTDSRWTTWFGPTTYYSQIKGNMTRVQDALHNKAVVVDCNCTVYPSAFAYVNPGNPYRIYVCGAFWPAANTGTDSKAGTLIHELTHFTIVAATGDKGYGHTNAMNLARSNPQGAATNADNHEYFSEAGNPNTGGGDGGGGDTTPVNKAPTASFRASVSGLTVGFTDSSTDSDGTIASRAWNFGDGSSSSATNPSKTYSAGGSYTVTLTVTDNKGAVATSKQTVTVTAGNGGGDDGGTVPGGTTVSGSLSGARSSNIHPGSNEAPKSWFQTTSTSTLVAQLAGPASGADFDLYLEKWNGSAWNTVAKSTSSRSAEAVSYKAAAGYYRYKVYSYAGSGSYTLTFGTGSDSGGNPPPPAKRR